MADVISGGAHDRPPPDSRLRRAVAVVTGAAVLAAGTWVVVHESSSAPADKRSTSEAAGTPRPTPTPPAGPSPQPQPLQPLLIGVSTAGPRGLRLFAGGPALSLVDATSGARTSVASVDVPPGRAVVQLEPVQGGTLVVVNSTQSDVEAGWVYLERPGGPAVKLLRTDEVVAGARPGRFWAYTYPRRQGGMATIVEATTAGRVLSQRLVPGGWHLEEDTGSGLLMTAFKEQGPGELFIVDPKTLRARRSLGQLSSVVAATPRQVAWTTPSCPERCELVVADPRLGKRRTFPLPAGFSAGVGVFDPDERRLAISYFGRHGGERPSTPGFVEVLDLSSGHRTRVPGVATPEKQAADLCWSPDGRWLVIGVRWPDDEYQRLGVWPVTGGPVVVLPGRLPGGYASALLAVTPAGGAA